jgi:hypothetical protein
MTKEVLLIGEDEFFLKVMAMELKLKGLKARGAHDPAGLHEALSQGSPSLVVFHHIEPMDLFFLNPRDYGYEGPLLLLLDHGDLHFSRQHIRAHSVLQRPFVIQTVYRELSLII